MAKLVPPTREDLDFVAMNMRQADVEEIEASHGISPQQALAGVEYMDDTLVGKVNGVPVAVIGVTPGSMISGGGVVWMLGTDGVADVKVAVLRLSRTWTQVMRQKYGKLYNHVDARNKVSVRWLKWLGFTIEDAEPHGKSQLPFHHFYMGD